MCYSIVIEKVTQSTVATILLKMLNQAAFLLIRILKIYNLCFIFAKIVHISFNHRNNRLILYIKKFRLPSLFFALFISTIIYLALRLPESIATEKIHISVIHVGLLLVMFLVLYTMYTMHYKRSQVNQLITACVNFSYDLESKNFH